MRLKCWRSAPQPPVNTETVRCRDHEGRRAALVVGINPNGKITLSSPNGDQAELDSLDVGALRESLRAAVYAAAELATARRQDTAA